MGGNIQFRHYAHVARLKVVTHSPASQGSRPFNYALIMGDIPLQGWDNLTHNH